MAELGRAGDQDEIGPVEVALGLGAGSTGRAVDQPELEPAVESAELAAQVGRATDEDEPA